MRFLTALLLGAALMAGGTDKATAQGLIGYSVILVLTNTSEGPVVRQLQTSSAFDEACRASSDLLLICGEIATIEPGMPAADAMARLRLAGGELVDSAAVASGKPLLIVAEDVEGEALASSSDVPPPSRLKADLLFQKLDEDGTVNLIGCDVSRQPLAAFVQVSGGHDATANRVADFRRDAETCADALQATHEATHVLQQAIPLTPGTARSASSGNDVGLEEVTIVHEFIVRSPV